MFWALPQLTIRRVQKEFKSGHIFMKDAECAETNEKSIFRFFSFRDMIDFVLKIV